MGYNFSKVVSAKLIEMKEFLTEEEYQEYVEGI